MKICSFFPTATEILYALGAGRSVVGRSSDCRYPPQVRSKPIVVSAKIPELVPNDSVKIHEAVLKLKSQGAHQFHVNLKTLRRLKPDLIITQSLCSVCAASHSEATDAAEQITPAPKVISINGQSLNELLSDIHRIGKIIERENAAQQLIGQLQKRIERVRSSTKKVTQRPRVWCCEWLEPLMAAGHWIPEMVELAGGMDGLGQKGEKSKWIHWDHVLAYDPDVIFVMPCSYSIPQTLREKWRLTRRPDWKKLKAVQQKKVFVIESALVHHAGPRLIDALELFAHLLHSERIPTDHPHLKRG